MKKFSMWKKKFKDEVGIIEIFDCHYLGGLAEFPTAKSLKKFLVLKLMEDYFELQTNPLDESKQKFKLKIPYEKVLDVQSIITDAGGSDAWNNWFNILYIDNDGGKIVLRLAMSAILTWNANTMCHVLQDRLNTNKIRERFRSAGYDTSQAQEPTADIPSQIEKLASLCKQGIISEEEFADKKKDLLSRM